MRINEIDKPISQTDLDQLEAFADRIFSKVGIDVEFTRHFLDRVNDERNVKQITASELTRLFKQEFKRWGKPIAQLGPDAEAVMKDLATDINMPFVLRYDNKNKELDLIAKTVMRKKDFRTSNPEFTVEKKFSTVEGGAMSGAEKSHPTSLQEGGSAPGVGPIHRDEIAPTLGPISKYIGVDLVNQALGSVGKRQFSGDIDVAVDISPEEHDAFSEKLQNSPLFSFYQKTSVWITKIKIENYDPNRPYIDPKTGENKGPPDGRTGYVQLDFMPGKPKWMKTYYHSPREEDSEYKGFMRNILLSTIAAVHDRQDSEEKIADGRPAQSLRYMWSNKGLLRVKRTPVPKKNGDGFTKANRNTEMAEPIQDDNEIANALGLDSSKDLDSFESLWNAINKNYSKEKVDKIRQGVLDNKVVQDHGIPKQLTQ